MGSVGLRILALSLVVQCVFFSRVVFTAEILTRTDGKKVVLEDDKTWDYLNENGASIEPKYADEAVTIWDKSLAWHQADPDNMVYHDSVALFLHYKNNSNKKIVGIVTRVQIINSFGKEVFDNTFEDEVVVEPGEQKKNETFWRLGDNPFINDQPYDALWKIAQNGTATIVTNVLKVAFDDGTVVKNRTQKGKSKGR